MVLCSLLWVTLLQHGGWTRWPTEVPSNPKHSVILCNKIHRQRPADSSAVSLQSSVLQDLRNPPLQPEPTQSLALCSDSQCIWKKMKDSPLMPGSPGSVIFQSLINLHLRVSCFHVPLFFSSNYLVFLTAGDTPLPLEQERLCHRDHGPFKHCCPTSITNCVTAHLAWSCLLSARPSSRRGHLERTSPSVRRLVSSHCGTHPAEWTDEPSSFPIQCQRGPGCIALLKMLHPDGNSHLEKTLQNARIHRTLLGKTKQRSLFVSLKPASAEFWLQTSLFLLCSLQ